MSAQQQVIAALGVAAPSTWNPNDKDADVSLSGGNLVASVTAANGSVRGTVGRDVGGHWYFEVTVGGAVNYLVGIGTAAASLAIYPGGDANGRAYYSVPGEKYVNNTGSAYGATYTTGDVIGVEINAGAVTFWKNGVSQGSAFTGLSGTYYPMWGPGTNGAGTRTGTLNVGTSAFHSGLPSGAVAWG
jgi:SPRY domain